MIDVSRVTYFAPYDNAQVALLNFVIGAYIKIRVADYSYNLAELTQLLIAKHEAGVDVQMVLDKSQSAGKTEIPEVEKLKAAGIPLFIGTSDEHKIMHSKFVVIDDLRTASGSYNFTGTAEHEDNFLDIESNQDRAAAFTSVWLKMAQFIEQSEPAGVFNAQPIKTN